MPSKHDAASTAPGQTETASDWTDRTYMARAIELAWRAAGKTHPNPLVGAVVVTHGRVVGEGYHHRCGEAHAEVEALGHAGGAASGGTMYVSLEPCPHHGRTPPCTRRIIESGVRRVVIPELDPDPRVRGRGVKALREAGISVDVGCHASSAIATNLGYYRQRLDLGPTVVLKMAVTIDGKIASAPGRRDDLTGEAARRFVHRLRAISDGIVVGVGTVKVDDPQLDCRSIDCGTSPVPVVFDSRLRLPGDNRWSRQNRPFAVVCRHDAEQGKKSELESRGGRVIVCEKDEVGRVDVKHAVRQLSQTGLRRLLVEGGAKVFGSFLEAGIWDALYLFHSPQLFGTSGVSVFASDRVLKPQAVALDAVKLDGDFMHRYLNTRTLDEIQSLLAADAGE